MIQREDLILIISRHNLIKIYHEKIKLNLLKYLIALKKKMKLILKYHTVSEFFFMI